MKPYNKSIFVVKMFWLRFELLYVVRRILALISVSKIKARGTIIVSLRPTWWSSFVSTFLT